MTPSQKFMATLLSEVPELAETYQTHVMENDEVLPHVLMGDITRLALQLADWGTNHSGRGAATLERLLKLLDDHMAAGPREVRELIAVSFLENLDESDAGYSALAARLGPALAREMTHLHGGDSW